MAVEKIREPEEHIVKTVWPSIAAFRFGRWIGRVWERAVSKGPWAAVLAGLFLAPLAAVVYLWRLRPGHARRYVVTDRRVVVMEGIIPKEVAAIGWDELDRIEAQPQPGQAALRAADIVFFKGDQPVLVLPGVSLAENFVRLCRRTRQAFLDIKALRQRAAS